MPLTERIATLAAVGALALLTGCKPPRQDFRTPEDRITTETAYTLNKRETRIDFGLIGHDFTYDDVGLDLSVRHGVTDRFELSTNVAHDAVALFNLNMRGTIVDRKRFGFGVKAGAKYLPVAAMYLLPKDTRDESEAEDPREELVQMLIERATSLRCG